MRLKTGVRRFYRTVLVGTVAVAVPVYCEDWSRCETVASCDR